LKDRDELENLEDNNVEIFKYILLSSGIFVCLYNQAMRSLIFMLKDTCMLVFLKVVECLYTSIAESLDIYV